MKSIGMKEAVLKIIFIILAIGMGICFKWNVLDTASFAILVGIIVHPIKSRYFAILAIILLSAVPFFLMQEEKGEVAERIAIYAYYSLVFTVMMAFYEIRTEGKNQD